jgi:RNA 3'-terminal phosphate cyclase-like protein
MSSSKTLRFEGSALFRARVISSILSGKTLIIKNIRADDREPGVVDYEASFLRLVDQLLDGSSIEINETGTMLKFKPGIVLGGEITHDCVCTRAIGWYVEGILPILIFAKKPTKLILTGVTNNQMDLSVDTLRVVTLPLLRNFGIEGVNLNVKQRGAAPNGGGLIELTCPTIRELRPVNITESGLVKRVRGVAFCAKISPKVLTRVVDSARSVLNDYLPDVYIHTDHYRGKNSGASPGFSLALQAGKKFLLLSTSDDHPSPAQRPLQECSSPQNAVQLLLAVSCLKILAERRRFSF